MHLMVAPRTAGLDTRAKLRAELCELIEQALAQAQTPEQFRDVAAAAAATGDAALVAKVVDRLAAEVTAVLQTSSSWELQAAYSKLDVWEHTGYAARLRAEAYACLEPGLG